MNEFVFPMQSYASRGLSPSLAAYRKRVFALAEQKTGEAIYNGSIEHASIVMEALFGYAEKTVKILTGFLNPAVYGSVEVVIAAHRFLSDRSRQVEILLEDPSLNSLNPFFAMLGDHKNLIVKRTSQHIYTDFSCHCAIADADGYRFEADKSKPFAVAAFGDAQGGKVLTEVFSDLWKSSEDCNTD